MNTMEVDKSKCLICEVSCRQKGLAFFRFPEEESRLNMWIKEISPLLDILKIQPSSLKENGRICARHFREKDFINSKHNSLVHNACPSLSVSNVNLNLEKKHEADDEDKEKRFSEDERSNDGFDDKDIFQCGRCKSEFEVLSEFLHHKRFNCQPNIKKLINCISGKTEPALQYGLLPDKNSFVNDFESQINESPEQGAYFDSSSEQVVKIISQEPLIENKVVSLVLNENGLVVGSPVDISTIPAQIVLTPQLPLCPNGVVIGNSIDLSLAGQVIVTPQTSVENSVLVNNLNGESQVSNIIITKGRTDPSNGGLVYTCPIPNSNGMIITSEASPNHILTTEMPNPSKNTKDEEDSFNCSKVPSARDASQQTSLLIFPEEVERKDRVEKFSQIGQNDFEKLKTKLPCSYCGKMFEKPFNLQQHERVHTGERPFQCIVCGRAFTQKSNVRKHMMRHRVWPKGKQTLKLRRNQGKEISNGEFLIEIDYSCQYCTLSFKSYAEHKKHLAVHSNFKVYRCIQKSCNETFSDLDEFLSHSKMHSSAEFQCHICLKTFTNLEELGVHQYDHDTTRKKKGEKSEIKLKCKVCHARFKTVESLKNHVAVDTHNYECVHCKSVFCSERFLRRHLFIHVDSSRSNFKCQSCKKSFRTQQNLKNHVFIHLKEKPFTCDHCDKQFASKYRLKRHVAIHLNQHLECPFKKHLDCDKTFYRKDKLRDHVKTHSHCRLRSCRICSKMYWTLSKLHQHMKRDHKLVRGGKEALKCFRCSQTFRKEKQLAQHNCTVEGKRMKDPREESGAREKGEISEAVSNIEIIMVPFSSNREVLT